MLLKSSKLTTLVLLVVLFVIQCEISASYKTEVEITPAPPEEPTTKKSWFKKWFGGSSQTTVDPLLEVTTAKPTQNANVPQPSSSNQKPPASGPTVPAGSNKPPPLVISNAPLVPLGPRPDTPSTSPFGAGPPQWPQANNNAAVSSTTNPTPFGARQPNPPQWPQPHPVGGVLSTTVKPPVQQYFNNMPNNQNGPGGPFPQQNLPRPGAQPNMPPGFAPYHPPKSQPSGLDLSYGGGFNARPQPGGKPGSGLAPMTTPAPTSTSTSTTTSTSTSTTTTTTTARPQQLDFDLRGGFDSKKPASPQPSNKDQFPSLPAPRRPSVKEDFPALPVPKSPTPTPSSPLNPSSPSAWNKPLPTPANVPSSTVTTTVRSPTPKSPVAGSGGSTGGVSFVPHTGTTTTVRPGFENQGNNLASDDEIRSLTETLYTKEVNSQLNLITVNAQGKTRSIDSTDEAPQPLLDVDPKVFDSPTIAKMRLLFNNYEQDTLVNEHVTPIERKEENDFVDAVMATNVMRQAMLFLQQKDIVSPDPKTHRDLVKELWFTQYSRGSGKIGSSGFEHVFVNEVKNGTIIGLHNWVYFHDEEKAGHLDYKGYLNQLDLGTKGKVMKVRFTHNGLNKPVNTLFIGTSPELELALYTVCFKLRADRTCPVSLGNNKFGVVTYSWRYRGKSLIGSAYPEI
ncbi:putative poly(U)-specific endoribonuclease [Lucilia cuprina]|uniref:Putative poly(U)-specific endoribonuclease n=1 Tax=Lucilia cuprina TaxID=7375 RepID=A0A0L0C871_LUCCU|nr:Poly(U)-specific endoribonuclease like protein [Lucilia cuprina]KNC28456.1 putative poly(U)-specific endoribonuclease [Lucilia cuprina]